MSDVVDFAELKKIPQKSRDIANGFIRQSIDINIPPQIFYICLMYYYINEHWTDHDETKLKLNEIRDTVYPIPSSSAIFPFSFAGSNATVYGNIDVITNVDCLYKWTFKLGDNASIGTNIGIDSSLKKHISDDFTNSKVNKSKFYAFSQLGSVTGEHREIPWEIRPDWKVNDELVMEFDTKAKTLMINLNKTPLDAFHGVDCSVNYHLAATPLKPIQIIDFELIKLE